MKNYCFLFLFLLCSCGIFHKKISPPEVSSYPIHTPVVEHLGDSLYSFKDNYLIRNEQGIWELYLSGNPLQLGMNSGALTQRLYHRQDSLLFTKLKDFVPSERKQRFLFKFLKWFNRDIDRYIPLSIEPNFMDNPAMPIAFLIILHLSTNAVCTYTLHMI